MEYLYFPLGGNKKGKVRTYLNLMIVMFLGGLWHGAAWSYAVWGSFHGLALAVERFLSDKISIKENVVIKLLKGAMVLGFVTLAWLLFKLPDFSHVIGYCKCLINSRAPYNDYKFIVLISVYSGFVVLYHLAYLIKSTPLFVPFKRVEYLFYGLMFFLIIVNSGSSGAFIYFQF